MPNWLIQLSNDLACVGRAILQSDLTSTIAIAFVTACAGAFAGAFAAQRIAERVRSRGELLKEIRNANAGISVAFSLFNSFYVLKKQHVAPLKSDFDAQKAKLAHVQETRQQGEGPSKVFRFQADFETLQLLIVPIERIQAIIFDGLSVTGRPLNVASALMQTSHSLNRSIDQRNELIRKFRANSPNPDDELTRLYFGLPDRDGNIDKNYPMSIEAIYSQTDDCIYFSKLLIEDLIKHGESLKRAYEKKFRGKPPNIHQVDLSSLENQGMMPPPENYRNWTDAFEKKS